MALDLDDCVEFALRLVSPDAPPKGGIDMALVYRLPPGPSQEVANFCGDLYESKTVRRFGFVKTGPGSGAEGFDVFCAELGKAGVPPSAIVLIPYLYPDGHINTYFEAHSFAVHIKTEGLEHVGVVAQPYHLMRAYLTAVSCLEKAGLAPHDLNLYPLPCPVGSWRDPVTHSQGVVKGAKRDLIRGELGRIVAYQAKGDLVDICQALKWL